MLYSRRHFRLLASRSWRCWVGWYEFYDPSRTVQICSHVVHSKKRIRNILTRNGCYPIASEMNIYVSIFRRHRLLLCNPREHIELVYQVLNVSRMAGIFLKLKNGSFITNTINYLGHVIKLRMMEIAYHTWIQSNQLKPSTNITVLRSFLGPPNVFLHSSTAEAQTKEILGNEIRRIDCRRGGCDKESSKPLNLTGSTGATVTSRSLYARYERAQLSRWMCAAPRATP